MALPTHLKQGISVGAQTVARRHGIPDKGTKHDGLLSAEFVGHEARNERPEPGATSHRRGDAALDTGFRAFAGATAGLIEVALVLLCADDGRHARNIKAEKTTPDRCFRQPFSTPRLEKGEFDKEEARSVHGQGEGKGVDERRGGRKDFKQRKCNTTSKNRQENDDDLDDGSYGFLLGVSMISSQAIMERPHDSLPARCS